MADRTFDTIILGAGVAGLAAAGDLSSAGQRVLVLEARDRIGGRVFTRHEANWPVPIELGAEFVHGRPKVTLDLLREAKLRWYDVADAHRHFTRGRLQRRDDFWDLLDCVDEKLIKDRRHDRTFADFISHARLPPKIKRIATMYVEGFDAADGRQVGTEWIRVANRGEEAMGDGLFRLIDGYDQLVAHLASKLTRDAIVKLETIATTVAWRRGSVAVTAREAKSQAPRIFHARCAIVTLPLGVLRAAPSLRGAIGFDPPLRQKRAALDCLRMGGVMKIVLRFAEPFWESKVDPNVSFMHGDATDPLPTWWTTQPLRTPVLTAWAGGPTADRLSRLRRADLLDRAMRTLAKFTHTSPKLCRSLLRGWHVHDWQSDPFARGAYSYGRVGGATAAGELAKPVDRTLFFAGEATHEGMSGTVSGAIETGHRAAKEVMRR